MNDYTRVSGNKKDQIFRFCKTIAKGLSIPNFKFIVCMIFGILCAKFVLLSDIARVLNEPILLKKTIERLSNRLKHLSLSERTLVFDNYLQSIRSKFDNRSIFCIDLSDISKTYGTHFEHIGTVFDGSSKKISAKGYSLMEIVGLSYKSNSPLPVYSKVFSNTSPDFVSEPQEILTALEHLIAFVGFLAKQTDDDVSLKILFHYAKRTNPPYKFHYYRIADGLSQVFLLARTTLASFLRPTIPHHTFSHQLTLSFIASTA